jgi:hypothetical protein
MSSLLGFFLRIFFESSGLEGPSEELTEVAETIDVVD